MSITSTVLHGQEVNIAPLETIDFARLASKDPLEICHLLRCCETHGFFYLDLQGTESARQVISDEKDVLRFMETYFDQPLEVKMKDDRASVTHGYKPVGIFSGVNENSRDCYETLKVARAEMVDKSPNLPASVQQNVELFDRFISLSHYLLTTLLCSLSDALGLDDGHRFEHSHRDGQPTNTTLVLLRYPQNSDVRHIGHNKHTDIGSLTLLFSNQWGLQVMTPEKRKWAFIQPRANHAIINVGDSLRFLSGKRLYSCLHRVIPVNGARQEEHRYSIAYFLRPESDVKFDDADGKKISAVKWHDEKYVMFAEPHEKQEMSNMLTGGMEQILVN